MLREFFSKRRNSATYVALTTVSIGLILASSGASFDLPKAVGLGAFSKLQQAVTGSVQWVRSTFDSIGELRRAREELDVLRERLRDSERLSRDIVRLRRENEQLRELAGLSERTPYRNFPARVIGKQPGNTSGQLILDRGRLDGVRRLMPVIAQQRGITALVGRVVTVSGRTCAVLPVTGQTSYVAARLEASRYDGLLAGQGEASPFLLLTHVSTLAVKEIAYQIRLRDIGGIIVIDFIDMEKKSNQEKVFNAFKEALKRDKSKTHVLPMSEMGLIQMTRKRTREPLTRILCEPCFYCEGEGYIVSRRSVCYKIYREILRNSRDVPGHRVAIRVNPQVAEFLHREENHLIASLERSLAKQIVIYPEAQFHMEQFEIFEIQDN